MTKRNVKNVKSCCPDSRRDFIKKTALGLSAVALPPLPVFAGPFEVNENGHLIPADKKLSAEWLKSLYRRGMPDHFTDGQLQHIGMPIGGIACGQLYLGGDGSLWLWHIFKTVYSRARGDGQRLKSMSGGGHYANPEQAFKREDRPVVQGAAIRVSQGKKTLTRQLNKKGFADISFRGEYPVSKVTYRDADYPVTVELEAFSPFIPGDLANSALPATIMRYKVKNTSKRKVEVSLAGWLENAVLPYHNNKQLAVRRNTLVKTENRLSVFSTAEALLPATSVVKEDVVFEDFEIDSSQRWEISGTAFSNTPATESDPDNYVTDAKGNYFVSSYNTKALKGASNKSTYRYGKLTPADGFTGTLTSRPFVVSHNYITFLIAGGYHPKETALNLVVDGVVVRSATGWATGRMRSSFFDVMDYLGQQARLQVVDQHQGIWGSIAVDHIVFTDNNPSNSSMEELEGYGSMAWSLYQPGDDSRVALNVSAGATAETIMDALQEAPDTSTSITRTLDQKQIGALADTFTLKPGEEQDVTFILSWYFPYLNQQKAYPPRSELFKVTGFEYLNRHYANWFNSANQVADYLSGHYEYLTRSTLEWNRTYYDSTLPYWLLDRNFISINCMATNTLLWFDNGRIWGWEGVECCPGTCQHVWQYAQAMARIFPEAERNLREYTDLTSGIGFREQDGGFDHRAESARRVAHDGHCGTIMRIYREHKLSADNEFLKRHYHKIKRSVEYIINEDQNKDGLLEGWQRHTLDARWYGPMGWISSLYLGALAAGKDMALEMGDSAFAQTCGGLLVKGRDNIVKQLFNGEYFIHKPDLENHPGAISSNDGCHIDQVLGQSFAMQLGISDRVVPKSEAKKALESIWKYNFAPDAFAYQKKHKPIKGARIYATQGEAGVIMTTWPKSNGDEWAVPGMAERPDGLGLWQGPGGYFDEAMNGFEYQVSAHMIWEGLLEKGLAIARAIHDRYNAYKRNPYNEIECSDHYSRSMASYGVLLAVCGFNYHGPKGHIAFDPKLHPEDFKAPFTAAEGWGSYRQKVAGNKKTASIRVQYGRLKLVRWQLPAGWGNETFRLRATGRVVRVNQITEADNTYLQFDQVLLRAGERLEISNI